MCGALRFSIGKKEAGRGGSNGWVLAWSAVVFLAFSFSPWLPVAEAQRVQAYLSADSVKVGERFALSLVADHNFMMEPRFPGTSADSGAVGAGRFGDLVVVALRDSSHRYLSQAGMRRDSVVYEVTTFALDTARVASIPVTFVQNGDTVRAATEEHYLRVQSVLPPGVRTGRDSAQLKPLTAPVPFPRPLWPWLLGGLGVLGLAALLAYLWWQRQRESKEAESVPKRPPVPPAEAARRHLRRLEETTDLSDPDTAKPFYTELSHLLRRYLMHRLGLRAFRSTTTELVEQLQRRTAEGALPDTVPECARRALEGADLAKFADQRPPARGRREALAETRMVIDAIEETLSPTSPPTGEEAEAETEEPPPAKNKSHDATPADSES